jgi:pyrroline-5-carboxylate reductase
MGVLRLREECGKCIRRSGLPPVPFGMTGTEQTRPPVAIIGGGTMARAIVEGARAAGTLGEEWIVAEPDPEARGRFTSAASSAADALAWLRTCETPPGAGQILLAVKPQSLDAVAAELSPVLADDADERVVVSILAGATSARIRATLGGRGRIVRVMPNTPIRVGRGVSAVAPGAGARPGDAARAIELFGSVGRVVEIAESLMDAFTAVAGSGPAYVYYLAEAMGEAAEQLGFPRERAQEIARETVAGAAELLRATGETPRSLRQAVTSKGGTTAAATKVLDDAGVMDAVVRAIHAARHRGAELSGE